MTPIRIATRQSKLALWQANHVAARLREEQGLEVELVRVTTTGDRIQNRTLAEIGGKGLFIKELESAMLEGRADLAVHSMKDVPMELPEQLHIGVVCTREDPRDALVSARFSRVDELPPGTVVGTSSLRRQCQLLRRWPALEIRFLRGNVNTRLAKLDAGDYDALILASAGLLRLGMADRIAAHIAPELVLPAGGQGAVGIELRRADEFTAKLVAPLHDDETAACVAAERALGRRLQGGCQVPIAAYAKPVAGGLSMRALVGSPDGTTMVEVSGAAESAQAERLGTELAEQLLDQGAGEILAAVYGQ